MITLFTSRTLLKLPELSSGGGLGPGELGVLIARAGMGKTACLIHLVLGKALAGEKVVHVSLEESPDKVSDHYLVILRELLKSGLLGLREEACRDLVERNRMLLAYVNRSFDIARFRANLTNLEKNLGFAPRTVVLDGLEFDKGSRDLLQGLQEVARTFGFALWLSALSHRHMPEVNPRGIPYPLQDLDDCFSFILQLQPEGNAVTLRLLKGHGARTGAETELRMDPRTFLVLV